MTWRDGQAGTSGGRTPDYLSDFWHVASAIFANLRRSLKGSAIGGREFWMHWGNWTFDPKILTLTHSQENYEIDLEEIHSSAAILDWIFQVHMKSWADAGAVNDLLQALDDILKPQANYCSFEQDMRADGGKLAREYASRQGL